MTPTQQHVRPADDLCVAHVPIFRSLSRADQETVARSAVPLRVDRGEMLFTAGDRTGRLFVVHTGRVKLVHTTYSGREHLVRVAEPGDVLGEHAYLTGAATPHRAEALEDAQMCTFAHGDLSRLVADHPDIAISMLRELSLRTADVEARLTYATMDVEARVAAFLDDLCVAQGSDTVVLPLAKKDVASYLGTTPESFSRTLARLRRRGVIAVDGTRISVRDADALLDLRD